MRGRKTKGGTVYESLAECLRNVPKEATGVPYEIPFGGKKYYICTTSASNAVRMVGYHIGLAARRIGVQELMRVVTITEG